MVCISYSNRRVSSFNTYFIFRDGFKGQIRSWHKSYEQDKLLAHQKTFRYFFVSLLNTFCNKFNYSRKYSLYLKKKNQSYEIVVWRKRRQKENIKECGLWGRKEERIKFDKKNKKEKEKNEHLMFKRAIKVRYSSVMTLIA